MGSYVIGGAVLFAIGFVTYEIYEGIKSGFASAEDAINAPIDNVRQAYASYGPTTDDVIDVSLLTNPITAPLGLAYEAIEQL